MSKDVEEFHEGEVILRKEALEKGLKRYFTGKPCKYGHVGERTTSNSHCVRCSYLKTDHTPKPVIVRAGALRCIDRKMGLLKILSVNWDRGIGDSYGRYLNCLCDCGNKRIIDASALEILKNPSCGCANKPNKYKFKGEVFKGCNGEDFIITAYYGARDVSIKFTESGYEKHSVQLSQIRAGTVKDIMTPSVYGFGINDCIVDVNSSPIYKKWHAMLERCYCPKFQEKNVQYKGCWVSEDWLHLSSFRDWWYKQKVFNVKGIDLDKDLLVYGNKEYGSHTCKLIPKTVNAFLTDNKSNRGKYPIGVTEYKSNGVWYGRFIAQCQYPFSKKKGDTYLGTYACVEGAFEAWRSTKHRYALLLVEVYKGCLDERAKVALATRYTLDSELVKDELRGYYGI